jgi:hypothetical protein
VEIMLFLTMLGMLIFDLMNIFIRNILYFLRVMVLFCFLVVYIISLNIRYLFIYLGIFLRNFVCMNRLIVDLLLYNLVIILNLGKNFLIFCLSYLYEWGFTRICVRLLYIREILAYNASLMEFNINSPETHIERVNLNEEMYFGVNDSFVFFFNREDKFPAEVLVTNSYDMEEDVELVCEQQVRDFRFVFFIMKDSMRSGLESISFYKELNLHYMGLFYTNLYSILDLKIHFMFRFLYNIDKVCIYVKRISYSFIKLVYKLKT